MKSSVYAGFIVVAAICSIQAHSQETLYPDYWRKGKPILLHVQGIRSCGTFVEDKTPYKMQTGAHSQDMAWVLGFLHGIDSWNPYDTQQYDYNGLDLWLENYCRKHPLDQLANAANQFYAAIGGRLPMTQDYTIWQHYPNYGNGTDH